MPMSSTKAFAVPALGLRAPQLFGLVLYGSFLTLPAWAGAASAGCPLSSGPCDPIRSRAQIADALSYAPAADPIFPSAITPSGRRAKAVPASPLKKAAYPFTSRSHWAIRVGGENDSILSPDRFVPFSNHPPFTGQATFAAAALGEIEGVPTDSAAETREQRRLRLKNAPFIE